MTVLTDARPTAGNGNVYVWGDWWTGQAGSARVAVEGEGGVPLWHTCLLLIHSAQRAFLLLDLHNKEQRYMCNRMTGFLPVDNQTEIPVVEKVINKLWSDNR